MDGQRLTIAFVTILIFGLAVFGIYKLYQKQTESQNAKPTPLTATFNAKSSPMVSPSPSPLSSKQPLTGDDTTAPNLSIAVENPKSGDTVTSPFKVNGLANTEDGMVSIVVKDAYGNSLGQSQATACFSKSPCLFSASVVFGKPSSRGGILEVFNHSSKDGSKKYLQQILVNF